MGNRFLDWRSSRGKGISFGFALACFMLFHSFLGNCERWIDDWYCSFWEQEGILEFFLFCFFCCGFLKIFNGRCCSFWRSKDIINTFLYFSWKIGDFSFCRSENISFEIGFFLSFLFLCSFLGNYGILKSWWLKLFILRENR